MTSILELDAYPFTAIMAATDAATDGTNASFSPVVPINGRIVKVEYTPSASVTADPTNFRTLTIRNKGTNGLSGTTAVASRAWSATNSTASTKELFTLNGTPANLVVKQGDVLDLNQTHGGAGLIIPAGAYTLWIAPSR